VRIGKIEDCMYYFKRHAETVLFLALGLITFYLSINFSKDWINYQWWYGLLEDRSWLSMLSDLSPLNEPVYKFVSKWVGSQIGFTGFVLIATVSLLFVKLRFLGKIVGNIFAGTFFYACLYLLLFEGTAIRISYAISLIIPALYFLKDQRHLYAFVLIILASQIHLTAFIFLIVFPLYFFRRLNLVVYFLFIMAPLLFVFDISAFTLIKQWLGMINPRYLLYGEAKLVNQNSTGLYVYFIIFFASLLIAIYVYLKEKIQSERFAATLYSVTLLGVIFMCMFHDNVAVGARLGELLLVPIVILLSWLYMHFSERSMYLHKIGLVSVFFIYFSARLLYLYPTMFA
jgi:hypothetical protein